MAAACDHPHARHEWIELLTSGNGATAGFGLTLKGQWVKHTHKGLYFLSQDEQSTDIGWVVLLEQPWPEVRSLIAERCAECSIETDLSAELPCAVVLKSGLSMHSDYWLDLSLQWMEADPALITKDIGDMLIGLSQDKKHLQALRHRAFKMGVRHTNDRGQV